MYDGQKVVVCGVPYTIIEKEDSFDSDATHFGQIDYIKNEIAINAKMADAQKRETICHEIVHAMCVHIGRGDLSNDEQFVQAMGNAIYNTFDLRIA